MSSMRCGSRPIRHGMTWSSRYATTDFSRPFSVASPRPCTPSSVMILSVTRLRPGQVTMTLALVIFMSCSVLGLLAGGFCARRMRVVRGLEHVGKCARQARQTFENFAQVIAHRLLGDGCLSGSDGIEDRLM